MTDVELGWAAGIIDGEGCLYINKTQPSSGNGTKNVFYRLYLKVTMGHKPTLTRIHSLFGEGIVTLHKAATEKTNASYSWVCQAQQVKRVLLQVLPHLCTKKEEALLAMEFMSLPRVPRIGEQATHDLLAAKEAAYWKMRQLKPRWRFCDAAKTAPRKRRPSTPIQRRGS